MKIFLPLTDRNWLDLTDKLTSSTSEENGILVDTCPQFDEGKVITDLR